MDQKNTINYKWLVYSIENKMFKCAKLLLFVLILRNKFQS